MNATKQADCTYRPGDVTCFNGECPRACVRNYRDQGVSDVPMATLNGRSLRGRQSRRHREPRLLRWLAALKS